MMLNSSRKSAVETPYLRRTRARRRMFPADDTRKKPVETPKKRANPVSGGHAAAAFQRLGGWLYTSATKPGKRAGMRSCRASSA
jgi:hypothetical protein